MVEAENKKYEELITVLKEDMEKKKEIIQDMQNSQTFYNQLNTFNSSSGFGAQNLTLNASQNHEATLADTRALLEKFRNDYKYLF